MIKLNTKVVALLCAMVTVSGFSVASSAALIDANSELAFFGTYSTDDSNLTNATELTLGLNSVIAGGSADFAFAVGSGFTGSTTFTFDPSTPGNIFTFANGGGFSATSITIDVQTQTSLGLTMQGVWSLDGFDDTMGQLVLTADSLGGLLTYSAAGTVQPIPVPAAVWLFGSALAALGLTRRRTA